MQLGPYLESLGGDLFAAGAKSMDPTPGTKESLLPMDCYVAALGVRSDAIADVTAARSGVIVQPPGCGTHR